MSLVRPVGILAAVALLLVPVGMASGQTSPPDSEIDQYAPSVPGAGEDEPLGNDGAGGGGGNPGGGGARDGSKPDKAPKGDPASSGSANDGFGFSLPGSADETVAPQATLDELRSQGAEGKKAADLAEETAPENAAQAGNPIEGPDGSALDALLETVTGSEDGMGLALPLILAATVALGAGFAVRRARSAKRLQR